MRLRQLSRKLDVDTEKIIHFLKASNLPCEDDSNAKLTDEQVELLISKFGPIDEVFPEEIETYTETVTDLPPAETEEQTPIIAPQEIVMNLEATENQLVNSAPQSNQEDPVEPEVIRAPKIELTGLKVVGKIELRVPKKKEESEEETTADEKPVQPNQPKFNRSRTNDRQRQNNKPRKNALTPAEQRQREEKIKQRRKKEAAERAKKKRKENYFKKVQIKDKGTSKKTVVENPVAVTKRPTKNVGLLTRFMNWMRRE